jgi:hypothetical protein
MLACSSFTLLFYMFLGIYSYSKHVFAYDVYWNLLKTSIGMYIFAFACAYQI